MNGSSSNPSPQEAMALIAKEVLASQRASETYIQKPLSPPPEQLLFVSKQTRQTIDFTTGDGLSKILPMNAEVIPKKKKKRQTLAVVPPAIESMRMYNMNKYQFDKQQIQWACFIFILPPFCPYLGSSKSSDDGDNLVPLTNNICESDAKPKTNFTSYDGIQMFTFTLDDD
jgi:hypothetical protein